MLVLERDSIRRQVRAKKYGDYIDELGVVAGRYGQHTIYLADLPALRHLAPLR